MTLIVGITLLLVGCSTKTAEPLNAQTVEQTIQEEQKTTNESAPPVKSEIKDQTSEIIMTDKKSVQEQTQEKINILLADGIYTDTVEYRYHSGSEKVVITIDVKDDIVTSASVIGIHPHRTSKSYQESFNSALPKLVVGKRIDQLDIPKQVSGGSLTVAAFKKYVDGLIKK